MSLKATNQPLCVIYIILGFFLVCYMMSASGSGQIVKSEQGERFPLPFPFPLPPLSFFLPLSRPFPSSPLLP